MSKEPRADEAIRDAAEEVRRETRAAAAEVRFELGAAKRETRDAMREAMREVRAALAEVWGPPEGGASTGTGGRMSRAQRKEMTRELLLDAAIEVFAEKGYHGASLDDVAEAAGFTKGAVYSNFTRKSDLFRALLERESRRMAEALRQAVETAPLELLPDVAGELLKDPENDQQMETLRVEFWLAAARDPSLRGPLLAGRDQIGDAFEAKLATSGSDPGLDGDELAVLFDALVTGLMMDKALDPEGDQPVLLAKALHKLLAGEPARPSDREA